MSAQLKKIKLYLSSDLNFFDFLLDGSYFLSELGSVSLDAIKTGGFDGVDLFDIADDGTLAFAEGINFASTNLEDGKYVIQVKGDDGKEILQMEFFNAGATLLSLENIDTLTALSDDWDGEQLILTNIDPALTIESIQVNDDRFQVIYDDQIGEYLLKLKAGKLVQDFGNLDLTFTLITSDGVFADTLTLDVQESDANSLNGAGQDGYIVGAMVWADNDQNGQFDTGEATDTTDVLGGFSLSGNTTGTLHLTGGTDVATLLDFEGEMLAPESSTIITPITTLIVFVAQEGGTDTASAEAQIKSVFGLDASINLTFFDPISALAEGTTAAEIFAASNIFSVGSTILNAATIAGKLLEGSTGSITFRQAEEAVYVALANLILGGGTVDLTVSMTVETIIQNAAAALGFTPTELANLDSTDAATVISDVNTVIDTATPDSEADVQTALDSGEDVGEAVLVETTKASTTAQGEVADAVSDGDVDTQDLDDYSLEGSDGPGGVDGGLQTEIDTAIVGDVDGARGTEGADLLIGSDVADDELSGLGGDDTLQGLGGNDILEGDEGNDLIEGGEGENDILAGGAGNDTLDGGAGADDVADYRADIGGVTVDLLAGTATDGWGGSDTLIDIEIVAGSTFADTITGDAGNNYIADWVGGNTLAGGAGFDEVSYFDSGGDITVDLAAGIASSTGDVDDSISGFEKVFIEGNDVAILKGDGADNDLIGGSNDDILMGRGGADTLDGGSGGSDTVDYSEDPVRGIHPTNGQSLGVIVDLLFGVGTATDGTGSTDVLFDIENITGSAYRDVLTGDSEVNIIAGGDGNDFIAGAAGNDILDGGAGFDVLDYRNDGGLAGVTVNLATGLATDTHGDVDSVSNFQSVIAPVGGDSTLIGDAQDNLLIGISGNDFLSGADGNDTLRGSFGNDTLEGGDGDDVLRGNIGDDSLDGGAGTADLADYIFDTNGVGVTVDLGTGTATDSWGGADTLTGIENIRGTNFDDTLTGDNGDNVITGGDGENDILAGGAGNDTLDGGAGADDVADYRADIAGVTVDLLAGTATDGWGGSDTLIDIEIVAGSTFADTITGDAGNNYIADWVGGNTLAGGAGFDEVSYFDSGGDITVDLAAGIASSTGDVDDSISGFERVFIEGNDVAILKGDGADNDLIGGSNDDILMGRGGADILEGRAGADTLNGGAGDDTLDGGTGSDTIDYSEDGAGVTVALFFGGSGTATDGGGGVDFLVDVENIIGSAFNDTLAGDSGANVINGGDGSDLITGQDGNDTLDGGAGFDFLDYRNDGGLAGVTVNLATGIATDTHGDTDTVSNFRAVYSSITGDSTLIGDAQNNLLIGINGNDSLSGGEGSDTLLGNLGNDTLEGGDGDDVIRGGAGNDSIEGGNGESDIFAGNAGDDTLDGGVGENDTASYLFDVGPVTVDLGAGTATDGWGDTDVLLNVENILGSDFADTLAGDSNDNVISGGDGDDTLSGGDGSDTFVLDVSNGDNSIVDFTYLQDKLSLQGGIVIDTLTLVDADSDGNVDDTLVTFDDGFGNSVGTSVSLIGVDLTSLTNPYLDLLV